MITKGDGWELFTFNIGEGNPNIKPIQPPKILKMAKLKFLKGDKELDPKDYESAGDMIKKKTVL